MLACCVPLSAATFIGYWSMKELQIGLTVATLPVTVLAVRIGVAKGRFSTLRFEADMGRLLAFVFLVNLLMAVTA